MKTAITLLMALPFLMIGYGGHDEHGEEHNSHGTIKDKIERETVNPEDVAVSSAKYLYDVKTVEVFLDKHHFMIPERKSQIKSFECTECHSQPLAQMQADGKSGKKAHWNIDLNHAPEDMMDCMTCHTGDNMDVLHTLTNKEIDFDYSFKLCGQCHSGQFADWKGGAHGKQMGGWANPRVSKTCVNCHDPHSPSFEPRWPSRYNTQKVKERK